MATKQYPVTGAQSNDLLLPVTLPVERQLAAATVDAEWATPGSGYVGREHEDDFDDDGDDDDA